MHVWPWRAMTIGAVATVLVYTATRPDPETTGLPQATTDQLIDQLGSSREVVQRAASSRLISQGNSAIPLLISALEDASDSQMRQIFLVLEDMYLSSDAQVSDTVEDAVEQLQLHNRTEVRRAADDLFKANYSRRQFRACAKIESFSGKLVVRQLEGPPGGDQSYPDLVVLNANWSGGEDGLKYLHRIHGLRSVHIGRSTPISVAAIEGLKEFVPSIRHESEGCLGVELTSRLGELVIRWVVPKSPADRAGLQIYDQLTKINGHQIDGYLDFLDVIRRHQPGADLELVVFREGEGQVTVNAELGSDFGTGRCRCQGDLDETAGPTPDDRPRRPGMQRLPPTSDHFIGPSLHESAHERDFFPGTRALPKAHPR